MDRVSLLEVDALVGEAIPPPEHELARRALVAQAVCAGTGPHTAERLGLDRPHIIGALVHEGFLLRGTVVSCRRSDSLLGPGDMILSGGSLVDRDGMVADEWQVAADVTLLLVDVRLVTIAARWPAVLERLAWRSSAPGSTLSTQLAIARFPRLEDRLLLLFGSLADRWGRESPLGRLIPVRLSHASIAALIAASRPPTSGALSRMSRAGFVRQTSRGWLLTHAGDEAVARVAESELASSRA